MKLPSLKSFSPSFGLSRLSPTPNRNFHHSSPELLLRPRMTLSNYLFIYLPDNSFLQTRTIPTAALVSRLAKTVFTTDTHFRPLRRLLPQNIRFISISFGSQPWSNPKNHIGPLLEPKNLHTYQHVSQPASPPTTAPNPI